MSLVFTARLCCAFCTAEESYEIPLRIRVVGREFATASDGLNEITGALPKGWTGSPGGHPRCPSCTSNGKPRLKRRRRKK